MAERKIVKYNFKRPDRVSKNQVRSLHFLHDRFARNFSSAVSAYMRTVVEISLENMVQATSPNEMVIHFQFQAQMKEAMGKIHLVIPTLVLEPIVHIFDQEEPGHRKIVQDGTLLHLLRHIPLDVSIETPETPFPMES